MLGLTAQPALLGGTNFAFGGARTGGPDVPVPTLLSQAAMFLGATGNQVPSSALYVVAALSNDARDTLDRLAHGNNTVAADALSYATNMATIVNELRGAGAQHILVMNTGDLGLVPYVRLADQFAPGTAAVASLVASIYDQTLAAVLGQASDLAIFDTFDFIDDTVASGAFANVTDACGAQSGADCSQYLFWDGIHVTAAGHQALANAVFAQVVAEPASVTLVAFALFGAALAGRRRVRQPG
jgi:outer membrane lipase/esterase